MLSRRRHEGKFVVFVIFYTADGCGVLLVLQVSLIASTHVLHLRVVRFIRIDRHLRIFVHDVIIRSPFRAPQSRESPPDHHRVHGYHAAGAAGSCALTFTAVIDLINFDPRAAGAASQETLNLE